MIKSGLHFVWLLGVLGMLVCAPQFAMASAGTEYVNANYSTNTTLPSTGLNLPTKAFTSGDQVELTVVSGSAVDFQVVKLSVPAIIVHNHTGITAGSRDVFSVPETENYIITFSTLSSAVIRLKASTYSEANKQAIVNTVASVSQSQASITVGNIMASRGAFSSPFAAGRDFGSTTSLADTVKQGFDSSSVKSQGVRQPEMQQEISFRQLGNYLSFSSANMMDMAASADEGVSGINMRRDIRTSAPITVWGHAAYSSMDNNYNQSGEDSRYDGDVWGYNVGADYRFLPDMVGGISVGYSDADVNTTYNSGTYKEKGWNFSPYILYQPIKGAQLSLVTGYGFGDVKIKRSSTITGSTDSTSWYADATGSYKVKPTASFPLELTARVEYLWSQKRLDKYTDSSGAQESALTAYTNQFKPGVEAAYDFYAGSVLLQPYVKGDFVYDFSDAVNDDKSAFNLGGGLRVMSGETGWSGEIEGERQFCRESYSEYTIRGLLAYNFGLSSSDDTKLGILAPYVQSRLDEAGGQVFGTGIKFSSADELLSCKLNASRTLSAADAGDSRAELSFDWKY